MTADRFRHLALSLPGAEEKMHFGKADFRVKNKIFASLPDEHTGVLKLSPEQQEMVMASEPGRFAPAAGAWGRQGWTRVALEGAAEALLESTLNMAWRNAAPKPLQQ